MSRKNPVRLMLKPVRAALAERGYPIPPNDLMIALAKGFGFHNEHELAAALKSERLTFNVPATNPGTDTAPATSELPGSADIEITNTEEDAWLIPSMTLDSEITIRVGEESCPFTCEESLESLLTGMNQKKSLRPLIAQARYNIRRYGHATISAPSSRTGVAFAELTDLPEFWSCDPEKHGRSVKPFDQTMPVKPVSAEQIINPEDLIEAVEKMKRLPEIIRFSTLRRQFRSEFPISDNITDEEIEKAISSFIEKHRNETDSAEIIENLITSLRAHATMMRNIIPRLQASHNRTMSLRNKTTP